MPILAKNRKVGACVCACVCFVCYLTIYSVLDRDGSVWMLHTAI